MDVLRTAVSVFGSQDPAEDDGSTEANRAKSLALLAKLPVVVAADHRRRRGLAAVRPDPSLGYAENFFRMCFGRVPAPEVVRCFETPAGLAYHLMGFDIPAFTPLFVMSRITGWTAHITEQLEHNALIRPLGSYTGPSARPLPARG